MTSQQRFGVLVQKYRVEHGLTPLQCARKAGIAKGNLSKIEAGKCNPTLTTIEKLARALKVTFEIRG